MQRLTGHGEPLIYYGSRGSWFLVYSQHEPNDDLVEQANFRALARICGLEAGDPYSGATPSTDEAAIENYGGAFGKGQWLLVNPEATELVARVEQVLRELTEYPLVDDEVHSELEYERAQENIRDVISHYLGRRFTRDYDVDAIVDAFSQEAEREYPEGVAYFAYHYPKTDDLRVRLLLAPALWANHHSI